MVEIREQNGDSSGQHSADSSSAGGGQGQRENGQQRRASPLVFLKENANDLLCFGLRLATLYFAISYLLPISSPLTQRLAYTKAFASAAATNAFRLHLRLRSTRTPVFTQQFLSELMFEDSAHYLFYCLVMVMSTPVTLALLPVSLYAIYHILDFGIKAGTKLGFQNSPIIGALAQCKAQHSANLLSTIACSEIFILPILVVMIFFGKTNLFTPFIYYRFLTMRYMSRRNPYTRLFTIGHRPGA